MLLDLEDPMRIIGLTHSAILSPTEPYEFNGIVPNVVSRRAQWQCPRKMKSAFITVVPTPASVSQLEASAG